MRPKQTLDIGLKRAYERYSNSDGFRILVERLWPRGVSRGQARIDLWLKDVAPSPSLRTWYSHDPKRWAQFKRKYFAELETRRELVDLVRNHARQGRVTFVYGSKEERYNSAAALKEYLNESRPTRRDV